MDADHLKYYSIGNSIFNKSLVSTSRNRSIARCLAEKSPNSTEISVLLIYTIKQNETISMSSIVGILECKNVNFSSIKTQFK